MNKKLLLFFLAAGAWTGAMSQDVGYIMRVNLVNGTVDEYLLSDHPWVSSRKDTVLIQTLDLSTQYLVDEIESYTFVEASATNIERVEQEEQVANISIKFVDGETVIIRNIAPNTPISVYSIDGAMQKVSIVHTNDGADVSLAALPSGNYIINIKNHQSIKVLKR